MTVERADKLNLIVAALHGAGATGLTRSEIAAALGLKKSPYLLQLIQQVLDKGYAVGFMYQNCYPPRFIYYYRDPEIAAKEV